MSRISTLGGSPFHALGALAFALTPVLPLGCGGAEGDPPAAGGSAGALGNGGTGGSGKGGTSSKGGSATMGGSAGSSSAGKGGTAPSAGAASTLKQAAEGAGRRIGVALSSQRLNETGYANAAREFNYVTPENEMKWDATEPTPGAFDFGPGDRIVSFAEGNGMDIKGHALVWHSQLPAWVSNLTSSGDLRAAMTSHVTGLLNHYRVRVGAWDVVNEAWSDQGESLRDSVFSRVLGETFIDEAFHAARDADADVQLFYNDFGIEGMSAKSNAVYEMLQGMLSRGVPIDGVGLQMHTGWSNVAPSVADFSANLNRLTALGLEVHVSEMDVHLCQGGSTSAQQDRFHDIVAACLANPGCTAVSVWGVSDRYSWLNDRLGELECAASEQPRGLLFDDDYMKKPAYTGVLDALLGR